MKKIHLFINLYTLSWTGIRRLMENKIWNVSFIIFVILPIIAKMLQEMPPHVYITIQGIPTKIPLSLPFSWQLLYFSALFVAVAKVIYSFFCPPFVQEFDTYTTFTQAGRDGRYLHKSLFNLIPFWKIKRKDPFLSYAAEFHPNIPHSTEAGIDNMLHQEIYSAKESSFWLIFDLTNYSRTYLRLLCVISLALALLCFTILTMQNIIAVLSFIDWKSFWRVF